MSSSTFAPGRGHAALRRCRVSLPGHLYHVTTATRGRRPVFAEFRLARAAIRALHDPAIIRDTALLAWVLMPDHLHVLIQLAETDHLGELLCRLKAGMARAVNKCARQKGPLWQKAYHDHLLRRDEDVAAVARYIVANPLRAGLVTRLGRYPHWDAVWL